MKRDLVILEVVALDAQLRRIRLLANTISDPVQLKAHLPRLIDETCRRMQVLVSKIAQLDGE